MSGDTEAFDDWPGGADHIHTGSLVAAFADAKKRIAELEALIDSILDDRNRGTSGRIILDAGQEAALRRLVSR